MRRWKRTVDGTFDIGDILTLHRDDYTAAPEMKRVTDGYVDYSDTNKMVEIDEDGNTIRIYRNNDKLDDGILVGGNMDKKKAMERLDAIENEAKELRKILEKPDRIEYKEGMIYVLKFKGSSVYTHLLLGQSARFTWFSLNSIQQTFNGSCYSSEQEALDCVIGRDDCEIFTFTNRNDALKFMMENS